MPQIAGPECYVEVYPFEGGLYTLSGRSIVSCSVHKNLREDVGTFEVILPPLPGPNPTSAVSWTETITPMSLVLIAMTRGGKREIVMIGIVLSCKERQKWDNDHGVSREIIIAGQDLAYYFTVDNWAAIILSFGISLKSLITLADLHNNPAIVAANWYNLVMAGGDGVNSHTVFPFGAAHGENQRYINFTDAMAQWFEDYPNFEVLPSGDFFFPTEGNWFGKFRRLLTYPVYEFFVMTAPSVVSEGGPDVGSSTNAGTDGNGRIFQGATGGFSFTMTPDALAGVKSTTYVVGRINVVPSAIVATDKIGDIDFSRWNVLPLRWPETGTPDNPGGSYIESAATFSVDEARNFYVFNGQAASQQQGQFNANIIPLVTTTVAWLDASSVQRYGYKPYFFNTSWLYDGYATFAQGGGVDLKAIIGDVMGRVFSYFHPTPLMLRSTVTYHLRPDIFPSMRFRYAPFKDQIPWEFYVEGVDHQFTFGGPSTTTLTLSRGLPVSVYNDPGLMKSIITGAAERVAGAYVEGVPPAGGEVPTTLQAIPAYDDVLDALATISDNLFTAQGK